MKRDQTAALASIEEIRLMAETRPAVRPTSAPVVDPPLPKSGWRGRGSKVESARPLHRWQQNDWSQEQTHHLQRRILYHRLKLTATWLLGFCLLGWFVYLVVYSPAKTLFYTVAATKYRLPLPPNSWAVEDINGYTTLDGETLDVIDTSRLWRSRELALRTLRALSRQAASQANSRNAMILYISMHGAVDANGEPCLIPMEAAPTQSREWITVSDMLRVIREQQLPDDMHKLIILDCNRMDANWGAGILYNAFADRLADTVAAAKVPNLTILNSTSPAQLGWAAPELRGSVFGYFVRKAIEGDADQWSEGGNGDRRVSLHELTQFVRHHVRTWVRQHRHDVQEPMLVPAATKDFEVTWTYSGLLPNFSGMFGGGGSGPQVVSPTMATAAISTPYVSPPSLSTPALSGPTLSTSGIQGPSFTRPMFSGPYVSSPTFSIPPVTGPGLSSSSFYLPTELPSVGPSTSTAPAAGAKPDAKGAAPPAPSAMDLFAGSGFDDARIDRLWLQHEVLLQARVYSRSPVIWRRFQTGLLRLEEFAQSGSAFRTSSQNLLADVEAIAEQLAKPTQVDPVPAYSLPLALRFGEVPETADVIDQITLALAAGGGKSSTQARARMRRSPMFLGGGGDGATATGGAASTAGTAAPASTATPAGTSTATPAATAGSTAVPAADPKATTPAATGTGTGAGGSGTSDPPQMPDGPISYYARSQAAWLLFQQSGGRGTPSLYELLNFVGRPESAQEPGVIEAHFLSMLYRHLDPDPRRRPSADDLRMAAASRAMAEQSAVPADLRSCYWVFDAVDEGDAKRRIAEDLLFVGQPAELEVARGNWKETEKSYLTASQRSVAVEKALAIRDEVWAELPFLAAWYARRLSTTDQVARAHWDDRINSRLLPVIERCHLLGAAIEASLGAPATNDDFVAQAEFVEEGYKDLRREFQDEIDRLLARAAENEQTLREMIEVLKVPMIPARQRHDLRHRAARIALRLYLDYAPTPLTQTQPTGKAARAEARAKAAAANGGEPTATATANGTTSPVAVSKMGDADDAGGDQPLTFLDRMTIAWDRHPALTILSQDQVRDTSGTELVLPKARVEIESTEQINEIAQQGEVVRQLLATLPVQIDKLLGESEAKLLNPDLGPLNVRVGVGRAERMLRAASPLFYVALDRDPIQELHDYDLHNLLVWYAQRTLDDFWGPPYPDAEPFFAAAAGKYLEQAQALVSRTSRIRPAQDEAIWNRWKDLRVAAAAAIGARANDLLLSGTEQEIKSSLHVDVADKLPEGHAAVWIRESRGATLPVIGPDISEVTRMPVAIDPRGGPSAANQTKGTDIAFYYDLPKLTGAGPRLEAAALFRGHFFTSTFFLEASSGAEIRYQPPPVLPSRVTVFGQAKRRGSVDFILDCSQTMSALTSVEYPQGDERRKTRLDVAITSFRELLARLSQQGNYYVGVRVYGHRAGRNPDNPNEILYSSKYRKAIPDGLLPSEDVEQVLSLGRFTSQQYIEVDKFFEQLQPWGETPLYLSIRQALTDFSGDDPDVAKSIVAITDGLNYQFNSPSPVGLAEVQAAVRLRKIPIFIIGFNIDPGDKGRAEEEFRQLCRASGGEYYPVNDATGLGEALNRMLQPGEFQLESVATQQILGPKLLGEPLEIQADGLRRFKVQIKTGESNAAVPLELQGSEAIELYLSSDGRRLEFRRDLRGNPQFSDPIPADASISPRFLVGAHRPEWKGPELKFPISLQNADTTQFSPPPVEAWVEINPVRPTGEVAPLVFYDLALEPGRGAPVLACRTTDWPADAGQALVRVWWKLRRTPSDFAIRISEALDLGGLEGSARPLPGLPDVSYRVRLIPKSPQGDPLKLVVLESYNVGATDLNLLKIETSTAPASISRRFDRENRLTIHTFEFPDKTEDILRSECRILFTQRRSILSDSYSMPDPLKIFVPDMPDVVRP